jgi:uncharacterized OB-fold protein
MYREILPPTPNAETSAFWQAASNGKLMIGHCEQCNQTHYYPRAHCPFCLHESRLVEASGSGRIYSFTVVRRAKVPHALGYIELDEGPLMFCDILCEDFDVLAIGAAVHLDFVAFEGGQLPCFRFDDGWNGVSSRKQTEVVEEY